MITLNKLIYDILEILYGGNIPDDNVISERLIAYWINYYREILVHNEITTRNQINDLFIQKICVEFEMVSDSDCCTPNATDCKIKRSTQRIPDTISRGGEGTIISIASVTGNKSYPLISFYRKKYATHNKRTGHNIKIFLKDGYMYIYDPNNENTIDKLIVFGVFANPEEAAKFNPCEDEECFSWDSKYPVTGEIAKVITDLVVKERGAILRQFPGDTKNDDQDNTVAKGNG